MEDETQYISKTQKKKEAEALQDLGLKLAGLSVPQLKRIEIPEDLRVALIEGKSITSNVAARRHRQFIGTLMRGVSPEVIRMALVQAESDVPVIQEESGELQSWMDKLLSGDSAQMEDFLSENPGLERARLRQLVRNIKKENGPKPSKSRKILEDIVRSALGE